MNVQTMINNFSFADFSRFECLSSPFNASGCPAFWFNYLIVVEILCLFIIYKVIAYLLREREIMKAFNERQARKAMVADDEVMAKSAWKGDNEFNEIDQDELSQKMREELAKKEN